MNNVSYVADSITPSAQKQETGVQNTGKVKDFYQILSEMSDSGEVSFSESDLDRTETKLFGSGLILPSMKNVSILADGLNDLMNDLYRDNGLAQDPPVELKYSYAENRVKVTGGRADADKIEELINADPDLKEYTRSFLAISSHAAAIQESMEFQEEYRNSNGSDEVIRKYSYLFDDNRKTPEISYMFGSEPGLLADGQVMFTDEDEKAEFFADLRRMALMNYVQADTEDEEESEKDDNGASEETEPENAEYKQLLLGVERTREKALFMHGTDNNKNAFGLKDEEADSAEADNKPGNHAENNSESSTEAILSGRLFHDKESGG